jgi:hypothetical protein
MNSSDASELDLPPPPKDIHESLAAYMELLDMGDAFVRSGLRRRLGPGADIESAYRDWNREYLLRAADEKVRCLREQSSGEPTDVR